VPQFGAPAPPQFGAATASGASSFGAQSGAFGTPQFGTGTTALPQFGAPAPPQFGGAATAEPHTGAPVPQFGPQAPGTPAQAQAAPPQQPNATAPGPIDPNLALQVALSSLQWQQQVAQGTMFAPPGQQLIQHGAGAAALMAQQIPGNDPRLASIQSMFPAVDITTVNAIFANKFEAENLLRLDASFLHRKKKPSNSGRWAEE
jgi:hypothetical protein